jgi:putative transposase
MPVKKPWWKGRIESSFYADDRGLIHTLPGTTFSNVLERGDYDSLQHACISLQGFMELLHIFLLDEYAINWHDGVGKNGGVPIKLWEESMMSGYIPCIHHNVKDLRYILYPGELRTIQPSGIDFETLRYQSTALAALRSYLQSKVYKGRNSQDDEQSEKESEKVHIKYNPLDLSTIYVYDPRPEYEDWLLVPAVDQEYTKGLSIHKHRVLRSYILRQKKKVDIYELAAAKMHVQEIVEREYGLTKKVRGRKKAARYLGIGSESVSQATSNIPISPQPQDWHAQGKTKTEEVKGAAQNDSDVEAAIDSAMPNGTEQEKKPKKKKEKGKATTSTRVNMPIIHETEPESSSKAGWSGDYELP